MGPQRFTGPGDTIRVEEVTEFKEVDWSGLDRKAVTVLRLRLADGTRRYEKVPGHSPHLLALAGRDLLVSGHRAFLGGWFVGNCYAGCAGLRLYTDLLAKAAGADAWLRRCEDPDRILEVN